MATCGRVGVVVDVRSPSRGDEVKRRLIGQRAPTVGVELTEQVHGPEQERVPRRPEREGVDELGGELSEVGVTAFEEVEIVVVERADDSVGVFDGGPEFGLGDAVVDGWSQVRIPDLAIKD